MMFDDDEESDLTEIEDSEDDQPLAQPTPSKSATPMPPPPQPKKVENKKTKTGPRLREPHLYPDTVKTIYGELKNKIIDVDPEYQRSVVWDDTKQGFLIDSLMNNYVVFPLVFAERIREDDVPIKVCIDGKQRITAIQQFKEGKISCKTSHLLLSLFFSHAVPRLKIEIQIDEHDEREVFQRVQNGVALSTHERLKAINGPNADLVRGMYRETSVGLREFLGWEKAKGKDFFMLGQIAVIIKETIIKKPPATQVTLARVETFLGLKTPPSADLKSGALGVIKVFNLIFDSPQLVDVFENIQPQFFVMVGVMIYLNRNQYCPDQLADAVRQMKRLVKADTAARLYKKLLTFVTKEVHSLSLKGEGLSASSRDIPALPKSVNVPPVTRTLAAGAPTAPKRTQSAQTTPKRKRATKVDDDEYSPEAGTQLTKRRKVPTLKFSDDDDDDDTAAVRPNPPKKLVTSRRSISTAANVSGSVSKAQTKVRSKTTTGTPSSTGSKSVNVTQPVKPAPSTSARTKNPMAVGVVTLSATQNWSVSSQPKEAPPVEKCMPTPPTSASNPLTPVLPPMMSSASAPVSTPPSLHASQLFDAPSAGSNTNRPRDNIHNIRSEPKHSPTTSCRTVPPVSSNRLGPLLKAKQMIQDQISSQATVNPRSHSRQPSQQSQSATPKDHEAEFQFQVDQIGSTLRSPVGSARPSANPSNAPSPSSSVQQQQPRTSAVPPSGEVIMADGTNDKGVSRGIPSFNPIDHCVPARKPDKPPSQGKSASHPRVPSIDNFGTKVDPSRIGSTSAATSTPTMTMIPKPWTNGNQDKPPPQSTSATLSEQKVSYRQMPPIPRLSSQSIPSTPVRTSEAQSGTRTSTSRIILSRDERRCRPSPRHDPTRKINTVLHGGRVLEHTTLRDLRFSALIIRPRPLPLIFSGPPEPFPTISHPLSLSESL
ncbi:hypothetical protein C0995_003898 [Termitomyces sp. Mi166|nr:hypothetical protein C0995_003898 [Termitomyces sp. Mi166\